MSTVLGSTTALVTKELGNFSWDGYIRLFIILTLLSIAFYICIRISKKYRLYDKSLHNQIN